MSEHLTFDPLTCDYLHVYLYRRSLGEKRNPFCDCGSPPNAHHLQRCSVTPIYAHLMGLAFDHANIHTLVWEAWWGLATTPSWPEDDL
jgi:hypothetical protein